MKCKNTNQNNLTLLCLYLVHNRNRSSHVISVSCRNSTLERDVTHILKTRGLFERGQWCPLTGGAFRFPQNKNVGKSWWSKKSWDEDLCGNETSMVKSKRTNGNLGRRQEGPLHKGGYATCWEATKLKIDSHLSQKLCVWIPPGTCTTCKNCIFLLPKKLTSKLNQKMN